MCAISYPRAYKHATREAYSHLLLDMRSDTDERLRVRAKVFDEYPVVYIERGGLYKYERDYKIHFNCNYSFYEQVIGNVEK